jgi:hypothetical protein
MHACLYLSIHPFKKKFHPSNRLNHQLLTTTSIQPIALVVVVVVVVVEEEEEEG